MRRSSTATRLGETGGGAAWLGLSSVAPVWDDQGDGRVSGDSMEESSTMYAVVADVHGEGLREVIKDSR